MNFPSEVAGIQNAVMTFKEKSKTKKLDFGSHITPDKEVPMHIQDQLQKINKNKKVTGSSTMAFRPQSRSKMDSPLDLNDKNSVSFNVGSTAHKKSSEENEPQSMKNYNGLAPG